MTTQKGNADAEGASTRPASDDAKDRVPDLVEVQHYAVKLAALIEGMELLLVSMDQKGPTWEAITTLAPEVTAKAKRLDRDLDIVEAEREVAA